MQLNKLVLDASPKTSWQCFDLGCRVALADFKILFGYWILLTSPIFILSISLNIQWGLFIFWLFKPWYERGLLYILSRTVFGAKVSIKQALIALPSQIKPLWFSSLTYRRLASSRSFDMAVAQLENLSGQRRSKRLKVLHKAKDNNTGWWTICCVHWEAFLAFALITLVQILLPTNFDFWLFINALSNPESIENYVFTVCVFLSIAVVAPFYVAGGFVAYLNRRVILEGWDIELGFTKWRMTYLANPSQKGFSNEPRLQKINKSSHTDKLAIVFVLLFSSGFLASDNVYAQASKNASEETVNLTESDPFHEQKKEITDDLQTVLDEPPFAQREMVTRYRLKRSNEEVKKDTNKSNSYLKFLSLVAGFMANSFEILLWILFVFVFAYIIYRNWGNINTFFNPKTSKADNAPLPSFISKAFKEELPDDIVLFIHQAIDNKEFRRALSILVRASFTYLSKEQHIRITKGMTENECLQEIKQTCSEPIYSYMRSLLQQWMKMAWAHQLPTAHALHILSQGYIDNFIQDQTEETLTSTSDNNRNGDAQ